MKEIVLGPGWLPWDRSSGEERLFIKALLITMGVSLLLGALVPLIDVPEPRREEAEAIPQRLMRMMSERQMAPEPPKVEKRIEEKPQQMLEQVPMSAARRKAASTGLLAMSKELAALSSLGVLDRVTSGTVLSSGGSQMVQTESSLVSNAAQGSGGIDTATLVREKQTEVVPAQHATAEVALAKEDAVRLEHQQALSSSDGKAESPKRTPKRDADTISETLDRNKGALYALYNRALRQNALLAGNVVFAITIEPTGKVSECRIIASELHDEELERKLAARIAMISFNAEAVPAITVKWPLNFLPN